MHETAPRTRPARVRSIHIVIALIAAIVVVATASAIAPGDRPAGPSNQATRAVDENAITRKSLAAGEGASLDADRLLAPGRDEVATAMAPGDDLRAGAESEAHAPGRPDDALILRTASLELEVADVAAVLVDARGGIVRMGGNVAGSDELDQGEHRWANVVYRVPVDRFSESIDALRALSDRVVRESTQSEEVTATVVDLDARITNLRASEEALIAIMERSGRIEDVLAVQLRLEDVRGRIERLVAQRDSLADRAAFATVSVTWFTPVAAVLAAQEGWSLAAEVDRALAQTVEALQHVASAAVWLVVVGLPVAGLPLVLLVAIVLVLRRRLGRDHEGDSSVGAVAD